MRGSAEELIREAGSTAAYLRRAAEAEEFAGYDGNAGHLRDAADILEKLAARLTLALEALR